MLIMGLIEADMKKVLVIRSIQEDWKNDFFYQRVQKFYC